jgi:hypothetical protein
MFQSVFMLFLMHWLSRQEWAQPMIFWLWGYLTASLLATGLILMVAWLVSRKPSGAKGPSAAGPIREEKVLAAVSHDGD